MYDAGVSFAMLTWGKSKVFGKNLDLKITHSTTIFDLF
jgi:hypothetical protein